MRFGRGARSALGGAIEGAAFGDIDPTDVAGLVEQMGKPRLAQLMAGTTDKKSRAYKNARDNIGRYMRGTRNIRNSPSAMAKIRGAGRASRVEQMRSRGSMHVSMTADVKKSTKVWKNGKMGADLEGGALVDFLNAIEAGDAKTAAEIVMEEYGLAADEVAEFVSFHGFEIE